MEKDNKADKEEPVLDYELPEDDDCGTKPAKETAPA